MSVYKSPKSPFYRYDFQINGTRFHGTTEARNKKEAEQVERQLKEQARADIKALKRSGNAPMSLDIAAGRYFTEVAEGQPSEDDTRRALARLIEFIGAETRMDAITDADVSSYIAAQKKRNRFGKSKRKNKEAMGTISNATINREVAVLKRLFMRSRKTWKLPLPNEPNWTDLWLPEAKERVRELHQHEDTAIFDAVRPDYRPWLEFVLLTGLRLDETLISWPEVNFFTKKIVTTGKGDRTVTAEITDAVKALLEPQIGNHSRSVFTYVAKRTVKSQDRVRGQRYPLTYEGCKTEWQRLLKRAGVIDLRLHDLRHDFATKLLRATGSLKLVSKALNHSDVTVTARYAHVADSELAEALEALAKSRTQSRTKTANAA